MNKHVDVVISVYNLIEHSDSYSKILGDLCQYYRNEIVLGNSVIIKFPASNNNSALLNFQEK